jgi:para-nitrobenzyl esterase
MRAFNAGCTQYDPVFGSAIRGSEDCLYLNVWRPRDTEAGLPVYVFIHGGGNSMGYATQIPDYQGNRIAARSRMVFVSLNFRLGPFGWFSHPALRVGQSDLDASGNYGTLDIIKALEWIQNNIEAFGGDPRRVTVTGQSAGGIDVLSLLISPLARGLFQRAMSQSGAARTSGIEEADAMSRSVIEQLLVADGTARTRAVAAEAAEAMAPSALRAYLRKKSDRQILRCYGPPHMGMIDNPAVLRDGVVIQRDGFDSLATGSYASRVPVILGSNRDELKTFLAFSNAIPWQGELYQAVVKYGSERWRASGVDEVARRIASHADQPSVYAYRFDWGALDSNGGSVLPGAWGRRLGAFHGLDVPFFLGNDTIFGALQLLLFDGANQPGRKALSGAMMAYLASFARTGDPNPPGAVLPDWPAWPKEPGAAMALVFDARKESVALSLVSEQLTDEGVLDAVRTDLTEPLQGQVLAYLVRSKTPAGFR